MNTPNQPHAQNDLSSVLKKICEIAEKSAHSDYIYRGEPECYPKVSSNLYREYPHVEGEYFDIEGAQRAILEEAKAYTDKTDPIEILTELQHFGGKTNLIDFTEDYLIALFFACDGAHTENGRVILLKKESAAYAIRKPRRTINRVESQKSVFVQSPTGFITPDIVVPIPVDLKLMMLSHLRKYHRISAEAIYNDLHGFIKRSASAEFLRGLTCQRKGDEANTREEKLENYDNAIKHYSEALKLKPEYVEAYNNRGLAYADKGEVDRAITDYTTAIKLNPEFARAYNNRGLAYDNKGEFDRAIQNYNKAIELNPEFARAYNNRGTTYGKKGEFDRAIEDFNTAIKLKPNDAEAYYNRGLAYGKKGEFDRAIQNYNTAIELEPEFARAYNNRGSSYADKGEVDRAINDYTTAIELKPDLAEAYNNRGNAYAKKGEGERALQDYNTAIELEPRFSHPHYNRGIIWLYLRNWEKAREDLTVARDIGLDVIALFHNAYKSVADFEQKHGVQLPEDIKAMLTQK